MTARLWSLEIWALAGCLASFVGLIILLAVFDGRIIFEWNRVTLNTVVSILSVALKVSLVFGVGECIGQWKWILFSRSKRELMDFERIDLASRGPLGSFNLLWRRQTPLILRLGVLVILLAIVLDPFSQQLVRLEPATKYVDELPGNLYAKSTRAIAYTLGTTLYNSENSPTDNVSSTAPVDIQIDSLMGASIAMALSARMPSDVVPINGGAICPMGNCTWEPFDSLGVCHRCTDLTSELYHVNNVGRYYTTLQNNIGGLDNLSSISNENASAYALPNGHFFPNLNGCYVGNHQGLSCESPDGVNLGYWNAMTSFGTSNPNLTNSMSDMDTLIWSTSFIHADFFEMNRNEAKVDEPESYPDCASQCNNRPWRYWPNTPVLATECALYYCVQSIATEVTENTLEEIMRVNKGAARDPSSWMPQNWTLDELEDNFPPEQIPGVLAIIDYASSRLLPMTDLRLYFPANTSGPRYHLSQASVLAISDWFQRELRNETLNSRHWMESVVEELGEDAVGFNGILTAGLSIPEYVPGIWPDPSTRYAEVQFERVATAMTNVMRMKAEQSIFGSHLRTDVNSYNFTRKDIEVLGHMAVPTTRYRSEWYWISLHGVTIIAGVVFCVTTMAISSREAENTPTWKSSALAAMSQGQVVANLFEDGATLEEIERRARDLSLRINQLRPEKNKGVISHSEERLESSESED